MVRYFSIQITETLQTVEDIEAETEEQAMRLARQKYRDGEIVLGADGSNVDVAFKMHDPDYNLPDLTDRYMMLAGYMNNQTDASWYNLMNKLEELKYGN